MRLPKLNLLMAIPLRVRQAMLKHVGQVDRQMIVFSTLVTLSAGLVLDQQGLSGAQAVTTSQFPLEPSLTLSPDRVESLSVQVSQAPAVPQDEGITLFRMGISHIQNRQYGLARERFQQALDAFRRAQDYATEMQALIKVMEIFIAANQQQEGIAFLKRQLSVYETVGDLWAQMNATNSLAGTYRSLQAYDQAKSAYEQSLLLVRKIGDRNAEGTVLFNLGGIHKSLGSPEQALQTYLEAAAIFQEVNNKPRQALVLRSVGWLYRQYPIKGGKTSNPDSSQYYGQSAKLYREIGDLEQAVGVFREFFGVTVFGYLGPEAQAHEFIRLALQVAHEAQDCQLEQAAMREARFFYTFNPSTRSKESKEKGIAFFESLLSAYPNSRGVLHGLGELLLIQGRNDAAIAKLRPAILQENCLSKVAEEPTATSTFDFANFSSPDKLLQVALVENNQIEEALVVADSVRAKQLNQALHQQNSKPSVPFSIQEIKEVATQHQLTFVEYSLHSGAKFGFGKPGEQEIYIWVVQPTGKIIFRKVQTDHLKVSQLIDNFEESLGNRSIIAVKPKNPKQQTTNLIDSLTELEQILIQPIADFLPTNPEDKVIFVADNGQDIPFQALINQAGQSLIERHTLSRSPSIETMSLLKRTRKSPNQGQPGQALVVGNPIMPKVALEEGDPLTPLPALPGSEQEAIEVAKILNTSPITGATATKKLLLNQMPNASVIHIASHGFSSKSLTRIPGVLALTPTRDDEGLLTSDEIFKLNLNAQLAVLSACDTGFGFGLEEGVSGLPLSFITAGVPSVVVSQWSVPDTPTAELMVEFYRHWQDRRLDKAQALRQAMLTIKQIYPDPKNWAGFMLTGDFE